MLIASGYGNMRELPATIMREFRMFVLSQVKDTIITGRNSDEGTPNQSVGLVFSTSPEEGEIALSVIAVMVNELKQPGEEVSSLAQTILDERNGVRANKVYNGLELFMETQVPGGTLVAVYSTYGVNDLSMSYIGGDGDVLASGYGVDLFFADQGVVGFVGHADGMVPLVVSSVDLPMQYIEGKPRDFDSELVAEIRGKMTDASGIDITIPDVPHTDIPLALAKLFDALTAEDDELKI